MTAMLTQTKPEFLTDCLIEEVNNRWKVDGIESDRNYHILSAEYGRKYIKVMQHTAASSGRSVWMFIDRESGECFKPASWKSPAKGVRYLITQLVENPHICDPYGSFLYL